MTPDSLSYQVVFEVSGQLPRLWWLSVIPTAVVAIYLRYATPTGFTRSHPTLKTVLLGLTVLMGVVWIVPNWVAHDHLRKALERGDYRVVEGTVMDFVPEKEWIKRPESFSVVSPAETTRYSYARSIVTQGLNKNHGNVGSGSQVRIADVNGTIARLEVAGEATRKN